ncbi:hypothetical protein D918_08064 [Trichuris suis]|nr:hypothetical protein D918_08064 [Trichuris suis]
MYFRLHLRSTDEAMLSVCRPLENSHGRMNNGSNNLSSSLSSSQSQSNPERRDANGNLLADQENATQFENSDESAEPMTITVRCDVCDMLFLNPSYLRKHLAEAHGMVVTFSLQQQQQQEAKVTLLVGWGCLFLRFYLRKLLKLSPSVTDKY